MNIIKLIIQHVCQFLLFQLLLESKKSCIRIYKMQKLVYDFICNIICNYNQMNKINNIQYNSHNQESQINQKASEVIALIKANFWNLTLQQAEKYYQMSEFAQIESQEDIEHLYNLKLLLQRRIDKLIQLQILDKTKNNDQLTLITQKQFLQSQNQVLPPNFIPQQPLNYFETDLLEFQVLLKIDNNIMQINKINQIPKQQANSKILRRVKHEEMMEDDFSYVVNNIQNISTENTDILSQNNSQLEISSNNTDGNLKNTDKKRNKKKKSIKSQVAQRLVYKTMEFFKSLTIRQ